MNGEAAPPVREPLRILYFVECLEVGGAFQTTVTVARQMKAMGHQVAFASAGGPLLAALAESGIPHIPVVTEVRHPSPAAVRRLVSAVRELDIQLLCPNGYDCTLDAIPAGLLAGCPVLPTYGGMFNLPYPHPRLPLVNVFSHELMVDLVERYGWKPDMFRHLIARIDGTRFSPQVSGDSLRRELGIGEEEQVLVMVCRHHPLKLQGVLSLLDAAVEIQRARPRVRIVLFGDGNAHAEVLSRIGEAHRQTGREFILAPGSTHRTAEAFAMADLVVANGARSALEGMACARPVISVGPNGFCGVLSAETIEGFRRFNYDKGRLSGNPLGRRSILADSVVRILADGTLRRELGEFSWNYAREHLIIQTAAPAYEAFYREGLIRWPAGRLGRLGIFASWSATVARFYGYLARRKLGWSAQPPPEEVAPPPRSLDPEWLLGLPEREEGSPGERSPAW